MFRKTLAPLLFVLALGLVTAPAVLAQDYGQDAATGPKENFWWLFASYAVIWVALFGYVARMAGRQQELERELKRLEQDQIK